MKKRKRNNNNFKNLSRMKKLFYVVLSVFALTISSCTGCGTGCNVSSEDSTGVDTIQVDSVVLDSVAVDSVVVNE